MTVPSHPLDHWIAGRLGRTGLGLTRAALEDWQWQQFNQSLGWARENSAFYRRHLAAAGWDPVLSRDRLGLLPFTTAADLMADPAGFCCLSQSAISRVVTLQTSGTSGLPKRLFFTAEDQEITLGFFEAGLRQMTGESDHVLILLPGEKPGSVGDLLVRAIRRLGATPILAPEGWTADSLVDAMIRMPADLIIGIPVPVLALSRRWTQRAPARAAPSRVLLCSDNIPEAVRADISAAWKCEIFADWGMTELGYGGGVDCGAHAGYHLQESDVLFEIVDIETGQPLPPGLVGEVVVSTLTRRGMPLIRYRTGDLSRLMPGACPCGSVLGRLDRIESRKTGQVPLAGGRLSMADFDDLLFGLPMLGNFSVSLNCRIWPPVLRVEAVPSSGLDEGAAAALQAAILASLETLAPVRAARRMSGLTLEVRLAEAILPVGRQKRSITWEAPP